MPVKHSLNILISKYGLVFKMILYYGVLLLIIVTIAASIVMPIIGDMYDEIQATGVTEQMHIFWQEFLHGDSSVVETFGAIGSAAGAIMDIVRSNNAAVTNGIIVIAVFTLLYIFFVGMANLVCSDVINNFMNSNSRFGFISNYIFNLRRSVLYALLYLVTYIPATALEFTGIFFLMRAMFRAGAALFALPLGVLLFLVIQSFILTLFSGWIPSVVADGQSVGRALVESPRKTFRHFGYCWMSMLVTMFLSFVFVAASTVFTFGVGFIIAFPTAVVMVKILELVLYYNINGSKFYETDKTVAVETIPDEQ